MTTIQASPTKLRSGEWGAKVQTANVSEGDSIQITTRAGKSWTASVAKVVWRGEGVAIVATRSKPKTCTVNGRSYRRERGYCYYPCPVDGHVCSPENGPCHDCM